VLYSLLRHATDRSVFNNYVAASPSLSYHDGYLNKQFEKLNNDLNDTRLYLTIGGLEIRDSKTNSFNSLSEILTMKNFLRLKPVVYKNSEHMGTAIPTF